MSEELLNRLVQKHIGSMTAQVTTGTVKDVDEDAYTCTVEREDRPTLYGVRLNAVEYTGDRFVLIPTVNSYVLVCMVEGDEAEGYLLATSAIDKLLFAIDTTELEVVAEGFSIKRGDETLKAILNAMIDQVLKVYAPKDVPGLTALKVRINSLLI